MVFDASTLTTAFDLDKIYFLFYDKNDYCNYIKLVNMLIFIPITNFLFIVKKVFKIQKRVPIKKYFKYNPNTLLIIFMYFKSILSTNT